MPLQPGGEWSRTSVRQLEDEDPVVGEQFATLVHDAPVERDRVGPALEGDPRLVVPNVRREPIELVARDVGCTRSLTRGNQ